MLSQGKNKSVKEYLSSQKSPILIITFFIFCGVWLLNGDIPLAAAETIDWSTIGWTNTGIPGPATQSFTNFNGSGVDIDVFYSANMFDGQPGIYQDVSNPPVPPLETALRWTNNNADAEGTPGDADGPPFMEIQFSTPVLLEQLTLGSLSELTNNRFEWAVVTAYDENDNPVMIDATNGFSGSSYLVDETASYTGDTQIAGRPFMEDLGNGTYRIRGVSFQPNSNNPAATCTNNNNCGYDRAILNYGTTPVSRVEVIQIVSTTEDFNSPRSSGLASIVFETIVFEPAIVAPPVQGTAVLGNCIWLDENGNGRQDTGEDGIANVIVQITDSSAGTAQTITDTDGCYLFDDLAADTYTVSLPAANVDPGAPLDGLSQTENPISPNTDLGNQTLPYVVNLADGEENLTADFGFNRTPDNIINNSGNGSIGDRLWVDLDEDGKQDPNEIGLEGVTVNLLTAGADGVLGTGDDVVADTAVTNATGNYRFDDLTPAAYVVAVDETTLPTGYVQTGDPDNFSTTGDNDNRTTSPVIVAPGDVLLNVDFGYSPDVTPVGRLGNKVWFDADASGTPENDPPIAEEFGFEGVTVALLKNVTETTTCSPEDGLNPIIATTKTDADGMYIFEGLPLDDGDGDYDYIVWVNDTNNVLDGLTQTFDFDDVVTPDCSVTALDPTTTEDLDQDFSYTPTDQDAGDGIIGDLIFFDRNGDGVKTDDEPGLEGVLVTLDDGVNPLLTAVTDNNGQYTFGDLDPTATYDVTVDPSNFLAGGVLENMDNSVDPDLNQDSTATVDLNATGPVDLAQDFGYTTTPTEIACLGNLVWLDPNANGAYDGEDGVDGIAGTEDDEPVFENVTLDLYRDLDGDGNLDAGEPRLDTAVTTATPTDNGCFPAGDLGNYLFENIPAGDYIIDVTDENGVLQGYWHSLGIADTTDESQTDPYALTVTPAGTENLTADFGYYLNTASVGNRVWLDINEDGLQDAGEPGVPNVPVTLTITYPSGDVVDLVVTTDDDGVYTFDNLLADEAYNGSDPPNEPTYEISMPTTPVGFAPTPITDANGNANDKEDSDDPAGTAVQPIQGITDMTPQPDPTDEPDGASVDFGLIQEEIPEGAIGNLVWLDENSDGLQDPGEEGIPNVTVTLLDSDGDPVDEQQTDTNGGFLFDMLPADTYTVTLDFGTLPAGVTQTDNPTNDGADFGNQTLDYVIPLGDGEENLTADFGFVWNPDDVNNNDNNGVIGDKIWLDDGDGVQEPNEPGLGGVTVTLRDAGPDGVFDTPDDVEQTTVTDENGRYQFTDLPPAPYVVEVDDTTLPTGLTPSGDPDNFGVPGEETDNQTTTPVPLAPGDVYLNIDFGYTPTVCGQIGDTVWFDADASGTATLDADEFGIANVTVTLIQDSNGDGVFNANESIIATDTTDENGAYLFPCLLLDDGDGDADYLVWVNDTNDVLQGLRQTFDFDGIASANISSTAIDTGTPADLDQDFSYTPQEHLAGDGFIGDTIWFNPDGNDAQDVGESGLEGVIVNLTDSGSNPVDSSTTDENGRYFFGNLDPNETYIVVVDPANFLAGGVLEDLEPTADVDTVLDNETAVNLLTDGPIVLDADFGYSTIASAEACVGDLVWLDPNANGLFDVNEDPIGGVTIDLYRDLNGDGLLNASEPRFGTQLTVALPINVACFNGADTGNYLFNNIPADDYIIVVTDVDGVLNGLWQSRGADGLSDNSQQTPYALSVAANEANLTGDFGYYSDTAALGNRVWLDTNNDGIQDTGEPPIPGVEVTLTITYPNGDVVEVTDVTDANGVYTFGYLMADEDNNEDDAGLKPTYSISVQTPAGFNSTVTDVNGNGNDLEDSDDPTGTAVTPSQGVLDMSPQPDPNNEPQAASTDFGFVPSTMLESAIGNYIWFDENNDGVQDPGEDGIPNVTVELRDDSDTLLATRLTDSEGGYLFGGLAPGVYVVVIDETTLPAGVTQSTNPVRENSDLGNQTSPYTIVLGAGMENLTADFGYIWNPDDIDANTGLATIGDSIWLDGDGNGRKSPEEVGIAGVTVSLIGTGPDNMFDTADDVVVDTTTTDENGAYQFIDLVPDVYRVVVDDSNFGADQPLENAIQTGDPDEFGDPATAPDNMTTTPIVSAPGDTFLNSDFGYQPAACGQIGDTVWFDADASGTATLDAGEFGIEGVTVALLADFGTKGTLDAADFIIATATTAADGTYLFPCLPLTDGEADDDADYLVMVTDTDNVLAGLVETFDADGLASANISATALSVATSADLDQDFSYTPLFHANGDGLIGGLLYFDQDGNGAQDAGESGIEDATVTLTMPSGEQVTTVTDENGRYAFGTLDPTLTYTITVGTTGSLVGFNNFEDPDGLSDNTAIVPLTSPGTPIVLDQNFGYGVDPIDAATIGNLVWVDNDGNGTFDPADETPIGGVTVDLYRDLNGDRNLDPNEPKLMTTTTADTLDVQFGTDGNYQFTGLPAGSYLVNVSDEAGELAGYWHSLGTNGTDSDSQASPHAYTVATAETVATADFGYFVQPSALGNRAWNDDNGNGVQDPGEAPVQGVAVTLEIAFPNGDSVTLITLSNIGGEYRFGNLMLDEDELGTSGTEPVYTISALPPGDFVPTQTGIGDALTDSNDPFGEVVVPVKGGADTAVQLDPLNEPNYASVDFGFHAPLFIGDRIFSDLNNDGVFDPLNNEEGISDVVVELLDSSGDPVFDLQTGLPIIALTDEDGFFQLRGVSSGDVIIRVGESNFDEPTDPLFGFISSQQPDPAPDADDTPTDFDDNGVDNLDPAVGGVQTLPITMRPNVEPLGEDGEDGSVPDGNSNRTVDLGFFELLTLGNRVWHDENQDGIIDPTELGFAGVQLSLLDQNGNPILNPVTGQPMRTISGADGSYLFTNLFPGEYRIRIDTVNFLANGALEGFVSTPGSTDPDDNVDGDDNGEDVLDPSATGITSLPIFVTFDFEPDGGLDGDDNDNTNLTVDFGLMPAPVAVDLVSFTAVLATDNAVVVEWVTATEIDVFGFNIYRNTSNNFDTATHVEYVPSAFASGSGPGATYQFIDHISGGDEWYYWLETIETDNVNTLPFATRLVTKVMRDVYIPLVVNE